ncbi:MAG: two component transcriptional regulator, LytTR family [Geminicoccaceae bacterium]|jgi:two-component system LytT family response regulator|nr:two component transcriptional regulator, LytTR family [Geminicoccaceae bacterium]
MSAIRVVTVDDEPLARERISTLVRETPDLELVGEGGNGLDALDLITRLEPDLIFIDVEMPELDGFGVIAALEVDRVPAVVFITAYEHYALHAFEVGAVDYLHKPVTRSRFAAAAERAKERLAARSAAHWRALVAAALTAERSRGLRARFVVRRGSTHYFVPVEDVDWIDAADNYLRLHVGPKSHLCRGTMKQAEDELDPARFVRIHRSAIVAVDRILSIRSHESGSHVVELRGGVRLRSSRQYADRVRTLLR